MFVAELHRLLAGNVFAASYKANAPRASTATVATPAKKKSVENTLNRAMKFVLRLKNLGHVFSAPCGGALRKGSAVRAPHELAGKCKTWAVRERDSVQQNIRECNLRATCFQIFSSNFLCKFCDTFKTFEQALRLLVSAGTMDRVKTKG